MKRYEAIEIIIDSLKGDEIIVSANGMISRELHQIRDTSRNFYMIGSMGLASSIGLGLALSLPKYKIVILDGDGNILMNLGSIATIGNLTPKNLMHIVLDNESYESTGGQPCVSNTIKLEKVALYSKYTEVKKTKSAKELKKIVRSLRGSRGPSLILVKVNKGRAKVPRVSYEPEEIKNRVKSALKCQVTFLEN